MVQRKSDINNIPISRPAFDSSEINLVKEVIRSGWVLQGRRVARLEDIVRKFTGSRHAVAVSSGTSALHLALISANVSKGDEVIVPSFSFIATANAVLYCGARPVFVDIEKDSYNIDPNKIKERITGEYRLDKRARRLINKITGGALKVIMPVHQFGFSADMDRISAIADRYGLKVVEDAACALGALYKNKKIGKFGLAACFSFHPRKIVTTAEGGMITTDNKKIAQLLTKLRNHGADSSGTSKEGYGLLGYNYRMSDMHAALGIAQMSKIKDMIQKRARIAGRYDEAFRKTKEVAIPAVPAYSTPVYQSYLLYLNDSACITRDRMISKLKEAGISTRPGNQAIHLEPFYREHFAKRDLPQTVRALRNTISLPIFPDLSVSEQNRVIAKVRECLKKD